MASPPIYTHKSSLEHDTGRGHPERADRIRAIEAELEPRDWLGWDRRDSPAVEVDKLLAVHPQSHVDRVRELSETDGAFDLDTPLSQGSWDAALHAAGGACTLVDSLLGGESRIGFSVHRPPGHHAEPARAMGFCLFNNAAVAAAHAIAAHGAERVLIFDPDVHHGNGTNAIFHGSREVLFASIHQWPFYPGTGPLDDHGVGDGEGYSINLPVPARTEGDTFLSLFEHVIAPATRQYAPDLILWSVGYDAHRDDPVGGCALETESYGEIAAQVRALGGELGVPVGGLLEGGYDLNALAKSLAASMEALAGDAEPRSVPADGLTQAAAEEIGRFWRL